MFGIPLMLLVAIFAGPLVAPFLPSISIPLIGVSVILGITSAISWGMEYGTLTHWPDKKTPVSELMLKLELAEEERILEARRNTPDILDRQASYKEWIPAEIARLRQEARHHRRLHLLSQWTLFVCSAGISGLTAWYDIPQPGKGALIFLGFTVTLTTAAVGYFKPRERAFYLQQTADEVEQHATALDLGIAPYTQNEKVNLAKFANTVEVLRSEQRKREQQLEQSHQSAQQGP